MKTLKALGVLRRKYIFKVSSACLRRHMNLEALLIPNYPIRVKNERTDIGFFT